MAHSGLILLHFKPEEQRTSNMLPRYSRATNKTTQTLNSRTQQENVVAETSKKRMDELVSAAFAILFDHQDGLQAKDVIARVEKSVGVTSFEASEYPNRPGVRRFDKIVRFASIPSVKAGWLIKNKGKWLLTEEGRKAYK